MDFHKNGGAFFISNENYEVFALFQNNRFTDAANFAPPFFIEQERSARGFNLGRALAGLPERYESEDEDDQKQQGDRENSQPE